MKILKVVRDKTQIVFKQEVKGAMGIDTETRTTHEAPLKTFDSALQKLTPVICYILGTGQQWGDEVLVKSIDLSYTAKGTRSVKIGFTRTLAATEKDHPMETPMFQFDAPADSEADARECHSKHAEAVDKFIDEAEKYIKGERQQMLLELPKNEPKKAKEDPKQEKLAGVN